MIKREWRAYRDLAFKAKWDEQRFFRLLNQPAYQDIFYI